MIKEESQNCPECGSAWEYRVNGSTQGYYCDACGWNVVTKLLPEIDEDTTVYTIALIQGDPKQMDAVKTVAHTLNVNFLQAKKLLGQPRAQLFSGTAREVRTVLRSMKSADVHVKVEPTFPHSLDEDGVIVVR